MSTIRESAFVRDAVVATLVVVGLYGLASGVQFQPLQIPGYLLVVGFDALESVFGAAGDAHAVLFAAYLLALGVVAAGVASAVRARTPESDGWRFGVAGALAVVGAISLLFAAAVLVGTADVGPVVVTAASGLALLAVAAWLVGLLDVRTGPAS